MDPTLFNVFILKSILKAHKETIFLLQQSWWFAQFIQFVRSNQISYAAFAPGPFFGGVSLLPIHISLMHAHITRQQVFLAPQEGPKTVIKVRKNGKFFTFQRICDFYFEIFLYTYFGRKVIKFFHKKNCINNTTFILGFEFHGSLKVWNINQSECLIRNFYVCLPNSPKS